MVYVSLFFNLCLCFVFHPGAFGADLEVVGDADDAEAGFGDQVHVQGDERKLGNRARAVGGLRGGVSGAPAGQNKKQKLLFLDQVLGLNPNFNP